jgi:serine acetyltransferase
LAAFVCAILPPAASWNPLTYPGVHALIWHRIAHRLWGLEVSARLLSGSAASLQCRYPSGSEDRASGLHDHGACAVIGETAEVGDDVTLITGNAGRHVVVAGQRHPSWKIASSSAPAPRSAHHRWTGHAVGAPS